MASKRRPTTRARLNEVWRDEVRAQVAPAADRFAAYLSTVARRKGPAPWPHADRPELVGLERWGTALAKLDRDAGVLALVAAARDGFPRAVAAAGDGIRSLGFTADEPTADGAPVEVQIEAARQWLERGEARAVGALQAALDPSRQLHVWSDDLLPTAENAWYWYHEVGQCCLSAILRGDEPGPASLGDSYYAWPAGTCVGRGLVVAARGLRSPGHDPRGVVADMGKAIAAAFSA